jgi:hypothetical protein
MMRTELTLNQESKQRETEDLLTCIPGSHGPAAYLAFFLFFGYRS